MVNLRKFLKAYQDAGAFHALFASPIITWVQAL